MPRIVRDASKLMIFKNDHVATSDEIRSGLRYCSLLHISFKYTGHKSVCYSLKIWAADHKLTYYRIHVFVANWRHSSAICIKLSTLYAKTVLDATATDKLTFNCSLNYCCKSFLWLFWALHIVFLMAWPGEFYIYYFHSIPWLNISKL